MPTHLKLGNRWYVRESCLFSLWIDQFRMCGASLSFLQKNEGAIRVLGLIGIWVFHSEQFFRDVGLHLVSERGLVSLSIDGSFSRGRCDDLGIDLGIHLKLRTRKRE